MTDEARLAHLLDLHRRIEAEITRVEARISRVKQKRTRRYNMRAQCGTDGGYYRHRRITHTVACEDCKAAHRIAERVRRLQRASRKADVA